MAIAGLQRETLAKAFENLTFINFNYKQAIEHFIDWRLQQRTSASEMEAKSIVDSVKMIRPCTLKEFLRTLVFIQTASVCLI